MTRTRAEFAPETPDTAAPVGLMPRRYAGGGERPAIFLDRDGTLVENVPYNADPDRVRFTPWAEHGLRLLARAGYVLVTVSNQSGVARGFFDERQLAAVDRRVRELCFGAGVELAGVYYCPHHPEGTRPGFDVMCTCRKPRPGLVRMAARDLGLDLRRSWFVGDTLDDIEAGRRAGCRTVLLERGGETEWRTSPLRTPHYRAADLRGAAIAILAADRVRPSGPLISGGS